MQWNTSRLPAGNPFVALRRDFERQLGLDSSPVFAAMSVVEQSDCWIVSVDLPGLTENDISVTLDDGSLIIEGERKAATTEGAREVFSDRAFNKFRRELKVREAISQDAIDATLLNGVLTLTLHRKAEPVPAKINIRTSTTTS